MEHLYNGYYERDSKQIRTTLAFSIGYLKKKNHHVSVGLRPAVYKMSKSFADFLYSMEKNLINKLVP